MVGLNPDPSPPNAQIIFGLLKGSINHIIHIKETEEKPTYVATTISSPLILLRSVPYKKPKTTATKIAIPIAVKNPAKPVTSNSILLTAPKSPAIIPNCKPKFNPQPDFTMGTNDKTNIPFIPNLTITSLMEASKRITTTGAKIKSKTKKKKMINLSKKTFK